MEVESVLTAEQGQTLLQAAREAVVACCLARSDAPPVPIMRDEHERLREPRGAFVTLTQIIPGESRRTLRGCIGIFDSEWPLIETVRRMAVAAATRDPRFSPITADELHAIGIELSVLSPKRQISPNALETIVVGHHGLCISYGMHHGVLLPQVALEQGWDRETFLDQTCRKAGLPLGSWRLPDALIEVFTAQLFHDEMV